MANEFILILSQKKICVCILKFMCNLPQEELFNVILFNI